MSLRNWLNRILPMVLAIVLMVGLVSVASAAGASASAESGESEQYAARTTTQTTDRSPGTINPDGDPSDWAGVPPIVDDADDDTLGWPEDELLEGYATHDSTNLYLRADLAALGWTWLYFGLDVDQDINTGYNTNTDIYGMFLQPHDGGMDFFVEVSPQLGTADLWQVVDYVNFVYIGPCEVGVGTASPDAVVEVAVPLADIGEPAPPSINMGFQTFWYVPLDEAPDTGYVTYPRPAALEAEITSPLGTETYSTCQHFDLTFTIHNSGDAEALDVTATIDPGATAEVGDEGQGVPWTTLVLGDIPGGGTIGPFTYDMHCTGSGDSTITVTPAGTDADTGAPIPGAYITHDNVTVHQQLKAHLEVTITSPLGTETYSTCQHFNLTFTIHNSGEADALDVTATIDPGATAEVEDQGQGVPWTTLVLGDIPGGGTIGPFTYDMHSTASGDSTINVTAAGTDENTGEAIPGANITPDNVTVAQETKAHLVVEIASPLGTETYSTCQNFDLTFTIHNSGEADALDVTATIDPGATAQVEGQGEGVPWTTLILGDIPGGGTMGPYTYDMHCTGSGDSTITVTPAGTDENTGEAITGITVDSITVEQETAAALEVEISAPEGTETYSTCEHFDLTLTIHNSGEADALDVTATIDPGAIAEVEGQGEGVSWTTPILGDIPGGGTIGPFTYDVHSTASGNSTINVTAAGTDENTGVAITDITADSVTVEQVSRLSWAVIAGIAVGSCAVAVGIFFAIRKWVWKKGVPG